MSQPPQLWAESNWRAVDAADRKRLAALLPVGAIEAHGPHLPLETDGLIAAAMVRDGARRLVAGNAWQPWILPPIDYSAAPFAAAFPGTISVRPATVTALLIDIGESLAAQGVGLLAIASAHFDPANLGAIEQAVEHLKQSTPLAVVFPNLTRKPWALRLTDEFKSGACHAGQYESSVVMAVRPELVDDHRRRSLEPNWRSLSEAIHQGLDSFAAAGGAQAYFGDPAAATTDEGHSTIAVLGEILEEAIMEQSLEPSP
ncbi:MAG: creatininase family protein [Acidobacteriota bacterium]